MLDHMAFILPLGLILTYFISMYLDDHRSKKNPETKPFVWGFFWGISGFVLNVLWLLGLLEEIHFSYGGHRVVLWCLFYSLLASSILHVLMIFRIREAWTFGLLLELNPISWIVNYLYIWKRIKEMKSFGERFPFLLPKIRSSVNAVLSRLTRSQKITAYAIILWVSICISALELFQPFGSDLDNTEMILLAKILIFPVMLFLVAYGLYEFLLKKK